MTCVIVVGIPRSGTSALAGALCAMGVNMGTDLMPPMPGVNERGFFEDMELVNLHIRLMRAHEDPQILFDVPGLPEDALLEYREAIARREHQDWWGAKDPKLCFLLHYFLQRLSCDFRVLVSRRPFHESVRSMMPLYGGMSLDSAAHLLSRYLFSLERGLASLSHEKVMEVCYHEMLGDPLIYDWWAPREGVRQSLFTRMAAFLGLPGDMYELGRRGAATIDPELRHQR